MKKTYLTILAGSLAFGLLSLVLIAPAYADEQAAEEPAPAATESKDSTEAAATPLKEDSGCDQPLFQARAFPAPVPAGCTRRLASSGVGADCSCSASGATASCSCSGQGNNKVCKCTDADGTIYCYYTDSGSNCECGPTAP